MSWKTRLPRIEAVLFPEDEDDEGPGPGISALLRYAQRYPPGPGEACDLEADTGMGRLLREAHQWPNGLARPGVTQAEHR